jgi:amidase
MSTFTRELEASGPGLRLAVKDLIDMEGEVTTAGCAALVDRALAAPRDAACLAGARKAGARIVGRTNLHELALGVTGINPWFGTPRNPLDPARIPGGSSSGSAVAVADELADVALGTDTGGSVRIPAACCGVVGLKTTHGRIPLDGVWPLAPSFDTVGPIARTVRGVADGMSLLEPGFEIVMAGRPTVGRLRLPCEPWIDEAIDAALARTGWSTGTVELPGWRDAGEACLTILLSEAWASNEALARERPQRIGRDTLERLRLGRDVDAQRLASARAVAPAWRRELADAFATADVLVCPTIAIAPPTLADAAAMTAPSARLTLPVNLAGLPALALPVPTRGPMPASLQLIGPPRSEERLLAIGLELERSVPT